MTTSEQPHWSENETQFESFFKQIESTVLREAYHMAGMYRGGHDADVVAADARSRILTHRDRLREFDTPEAAAQAMVDRYTIREASRVSARREGRHLRRQIPTQADALEAASAPSLPEDLEMKIMDVVKRVGPIVATMEENGFTRGDSKIFKLEWCRQAGVADLEHHRMDEAAEIAGVPAEELKQHLAAQSLSDKDRQAWSRARRKVGAVFTVSSLLAISFLAVLVNVAGAAVHQ